MYVLNVHINTCYSEVKFSTAVCLQTHTPDKQFHVPAGTLSFSVIVYSICAIAALSLLVIRRYLPVFGRAELGGPTGPKIFSGVIFIALWVIYVILSALQAKGIISF